MPLCCPPGRGCNQRAGEEPCALALCREMAGEEPRAALAVARWGEWNSARARPGASRREKRFRRRAYERARDAAIVAVLMRRARLARREHSRGRARAGTRIGALLGDSLAAQRR